MKRPEKEPGRRRKTKHTCLGCGRPALFRGSNGRVHADEDHTLCSACYRNQRNAVFASKM